jgi:hypothetical protein
MGRRIGKGKKNTNTTRASWGRYATIGTGVTAAVAAGVAAYVRYVKPK